MNVKLIQRLDRLDRVIEGNCTTLFEQIMKAAFSAISDADLSLIGEWLRRGPLPFLECQPDVQAALVRFDAEGDTAARQMTGMRFSRIGPRLYQRVPKRISPIT